MSLSDFSYCVGCRGFLSGENGISYTVDTNSRFRFGSVLRTRLFSRSLSPGTQRPGVHRVSGVFGTMKRDSLKGVEETR